MDTCGPAVDTAAAYYGCGPVSPDDSRRVREPERDKNPAMRWYRILVAFSLALQAVVLAGLLQRTRPWLTGDSTRYIALADAWSQGLGYGLVTARGWEAEGVRMPGYPAFILLTRALSMGADGGRLLGVVLAQALMYLASVILTYFVARDLFGRIPALWFLLISAAYPFIAYSAGQISPEIPTTFFVVLAVFLLRKTTWARMLAAAAAIAAATYFRPNLLLAAVALAAGMVVADRRLLGRAASMALVSLMLMLPWAWRNQAVFGQFTPVTVFKGTGVSLFLATWQSRLPARQLIEYGMRGSISDELVRSGMIDQIRTVNRQVGVPSQTVFATIEAFPGNQTKALADSAYRQAAVENIKRWPATYLASVGKNSLRMWFSAYMPTSIAPALRWGLVVEGGLVLLLALFGAAMSLRNIRRNLSPLIAGSIALLVYFSATLCWLHTEARYTVPARLILLVFAARAVEQVRQTIVVRWRATTLPLEPSAEKG